MAVRTSRLVMPPPPRGKPYYDVARGRKMILPREGGKAVPYIEGERPRFDARKTLRRTGLVARNEAAGARTDVARFGRTFARETGIARIGAGELLVYMGYTLLGLALLDTALRGRGPAAVGVLFDGAGRNLRRLFSPTDPIVAYRASGGATPRRSSSASGGRPGPAAAPAGDVRPAGRLVPLGTNPSIRIDRGVADVVGSIESEFGVRVTSGYRSPGRNASVGGAPRSDHLCGLAADFAGPSAAMSRLLGWAKGQRFAVVADEGDHVHISFNRCPGR